MFHYIVASYIIFSLHYIILRLATLHYLIHYTEASYITLTLHYRRYSPGGLRAGAGAEQRCIQQPPLY